MDNNFCSRPPVPSMGKQNKLWIKITSFIFPGSVWLVNNPIVLIRCHVTKSSVSIHFPYNVLITIRIPLKKHTIFYSSSRFRVLFFFPYYVISLSNHWFLIVIARIKHSHKIRSENKNWIIENWDLSKLNYWEGEETFAQVLFFTCFAVFQNRWKN